MSRSPLASPRAVERPGSAQVGGSVASPPGWATALVDLDRPITDVPTGGADRLAVTFMTRGQVLGTAVLATAGDPHPAALLRDEAQQSYGTEIHKVRAAAAVAPVPAPLPTATVVVCTADRPESLEQCLASLQQLEGGPPEIVVVDNSRSRWEDTAAVVRGWGARYVREPVAGLDRARNRGLAASSGEVMLCTDDDVEVHPGWARELLAAYEDPLVMAATGLVLPARLDTVARQESERWAGHGRGYRRRVVDGATADPMVAGAFGVGSSMSFRTDYLRAIGGFPPELDAGTATRSGGDTWALFRVLFDGYRIAYQPSAVVFHHHREHRDALRAMVRGYGSGYFSYVARAASAGERALPIAARGAADRLTFLVREAARAALGRPGAPPRDLAFDQLGGALEALPLYRRARRVARTAPPGPSFAGARRPAPWLEPFRPGPPPAPDEVLPSLSVVIPTRGRADGVVRLLDALDDQCYPGDVEVVVVVDGDVDDTAGRVRTRRGRLPVRALVLDAPPGRGNGPGVARNRGAAAAAHDVLLFLDDDVVPQHDGVLVEHGRRHHEGLAVVVGPCPVDLRDSRALLELRLRNWWCDHASAMLGREAADFTDVCSGNLSVRKATFEAVGGFVDLPRREDWELGHRLLRAGVPVQVAAGAGTPQTFVDTSIRKVLGDRLREGAGDVELVRRHPELLGSLPVRRWRDTKRGPLLATCVAVGADTGALVAIGGAALAVLDRLGARRRHGRVLQALSTAAYWSGVGRAAGGVVAWERLVAEADLRVTDAVPFVVDNGPITSFDGRDIAVWYGGRPLGNLPAAFGGGVSLPQFRTAAVEVLARAALVAQVEERWA